MTVEQSDVVDFITIEHGSGRVLLTISDHLDWDQDEGEHLLMLQEKLNAYLAFIESEEINERCPQARGREIVIDLVGKYPLSEEASKFVQLAKTFIHDAGFSLEFRLLRED